MIIRFSCIYFPSVHSSLSCHTGVVSRSVQVWFASRTGTVREAYLCSTSTVQVW